VPLKTKVAEDSYYSLQALIQLVYSVTLNEKLSYCYIKANIIFH